MTGLVVAALAAGLALAPWPAATASSHGSALSAGWASSGWASSVGSQGGVADLPGVPAAGLLTHGRVLVLRPRRLEVALDGRVVRSVAVRQPVDLATLPRLVADPAYVAATGGGAGVRLGAVLAQRPGTVLTGAGLRLELAGTGGAGPARLTGTRAQLRLQYCTVVATAAARPGGAPGLRYLNASRLDLTDVTLRGLGSVARRGAGGAAAVRADGGSHVALRRVAVSGGGRGIEVRDAAGLVVQGLSGDDVGGTLLDVSGGTGARLAAVSSGGAAGAAVRVRDAAGTVLDGLSSTGDRAALVTAGVAGLRATGVRARGDGLVLGGRDVQVVDPDVDTPATAVRVEPGADVAVHGGTLRGAVGARAAPSGRRGELVLRGVTTEGPVQSSVRVEAPRPRGPDPLTGERAASWWDRPVRGAGALGLVVLVSGVALELLRGRSRHREGRGAAGAAAAPPGGDGGADGELVLDLGERGRT